MSTNARSEEERQISFVFNDLKRDINLVLILSSPGNFKDMDPLCWKVVNLPAGMIGLAKVTYSGVTAFSIPNDDTGLVDAESPTVSCQVGQRCTIKTDDQRKNYLVPAVYGQPKVITCHFDTSSPADVVFGLIDSGGQSSLSPISKYKSIMPGNDLSLRFTPILSIYAIDGYNAGDVITSNVRDSELLLHQDLGYLPPKTKWEVLFDENSGAIKIERQRN